SIAIHKNICKAYARHRFALRISEGRQPTDVSVVAEYMWIKFAECFLTGPPLWNARQGLLASVQLSTRICVLEFIRKNAGHRFRVVRIERVRPSLLGVSQFVRKLILGWAIARPQRRKQHYRDHGLYQQMLHVRPLFL